MPLKQENVNTTLADREGDRAAEERALRAARRSGIREDDARLIEDAAIAKFAYKTPTALLGDLREPLTPFVLLLQELSEQSMVVSANSVRDAALDTYSALLAVRADIESRLLIKLEVLDNVSWPEFGLQLTDFGFMRTLHGYRLEHGDVSYTSVAPPYMPILAWLTAGYDRHVPVLLRLLSHVNQGIAGIEYYDKTSFVHDLWRAAWAVCDIVELIYRLVIFPYPSLPTRFGSPEV